MADISEVLAAIDRVLAGPRGTMLEVRTPVVMGHRGREIRVDDPIVADGVIVHPGGPVYGLTKRQCRKIQSAIYEAARADLGDAGGG